MMFMSNYKEMYHIMFNATEQAINLLIYAQRKCEELYIGEDAEPKIIQLFTKIEETEDP